MKFKTIFLLFITSLCVLSATTIFAVAQPTATRLMLSNESTMTNPQYFQCDISIDNRYPSSIKIQKKFVRVIMNNYAQMVHKFNGLGILDTTAGYVNQYTFATYNDTGFKHPSNGFVDVFVLKPNYKVKCNIVKAPTQKRPLAPIYG